jgi:hypothetical protein
LEWQSDGGLVVTDEYGTVDRFVRAMPARYTAADLAAYAGSYVSDEAEVTLTAAVENGQLLLKRRPDTTIALTPLYADAFSGSIGMVVFRREAGRITGLNLAQDRVWNLRLERRQAAPTTSASR